jgi:pimeloyl-ACP methyl ester carboxylesterase
MKRRLRRATALNHVLLSLLTLTWLATFSSECLAQTSPRPIVFVHGFVGDSDGWGDAGVITSFRGSLINKLVGGSAGYANANDYDLYFDGGAVRYSVNGNPSTDPYAINSVPGNARFFSIRFYSGNPSDSFNRLTTANISVVNKAYELSQVINAVTQITNVKDVILIAHSQGGLVARTYIEGLGSISPCIDIDYLSPCSPGQVKYGGNVAHLLSLDSPYGGADVTQFFLFMASLYDFGTGTIPMNAFELLPSSSLLNAINYDSGIGGALPKALPGTLTIDSIESYLSDLGYQCPNTPQQQCYSDDVVDSVSQAVRENIYPTQLSPKLKDLGNPIASTDPQVEALYPLGGCYPVLPDSPFPPAVGNPVLLHFLSCMGAVTQTQSTAYGSILPHLQGKQKGSSGSPATTLAATSITASGATIAGTINPQGANGATVFYWGTDPTPNYQQCPLSGCALTANFATQSFHASLGGLLSNTTYYFRMVFYDSDNGTYQYGAIRSFKTFD